MLTYAQVPLVDGAVVKADDINQEVGAPISIIDGGIEGIQLPLLSYDSDDMEDDEPGYEADNGDRLVQQAANVFANTLVRPTYGSSTPDIQTAIATLNPALCPNGWFQPWLDTYQQGSAIATGSKGFQRILEMEPGMVHGAACVDIRRPTDVIRVDGTQEASNTGAWWRVGVFVNNELVGDSGRNYPSRYTCWVPFSTLSAGGTVTVEIRLMFAPGIPPNDGQVTDGKTFTYDAFAVPGPPAQIFQSILSVRGQVR